MTDQNFDPTTYLNSFRETFASVTKAQQEGLKALERLARFQYSVAGDYLEAGIAQAQAALSAKTPVELFSKQTELGTQLGEKLRTRAQEFSTLANEVQGSAAAFARANGPAKKAA